MPEKFNLNLLLGLVFILLLVITASVMPKTLSTTQGATYYVDCAAGSDQNSGYDPLRAWRSMSKANGADLKPGDRLLFKRGCIWPHRLDASWKGTNTRPIVVGAYGSGDLPVIENGINHNVAIRGSYLILEYLHVRTDPLQTDPGCEDQPYGYFQVGFNFLEGASYNILRFSRATGHTAGVKIHYEAHHNRILYNTLENNNVLLHLDRSDPQNDIGAWGILVNGNDNELAYNHFSDNNAWCSYDFGHTGNSIELFAAQRNKIHHNTSIGDETFSELGSQPDRRSVDNVFAYNLHVSSSTRARFLITRGPEDTQWGPVLRTTVLNNTIYLTSPDSQGVVCGAGCSPSILDLRNNIIWAEEKAAFADGSFSESNNIYWSSDGIPLVQFLDFKLDFLSMRIDPRFIDAAGGDFRLASTSPAIDAARRTVWGEDLIGSRLPYGAGYDIGAFEYSPED